MYEPGTKGKADVVLNEAISFTLITTSPLFCFFCYIAYSDFDSSLVDATVELLSHGPVAFFSHHLPRVSSKAIAYYLLWVLFQAVLYRFLPGPLHFGPRTCGGRRLPYKLNGLFAWIVTVSAASAISYGGFADPALIAKHWGELVVAATMYSAFMIFIFYIKARTWPDNQGETLLTEHFCYNLFNGGELHPRTGQLFDWKHFNASRTGGILLWTLMQVNAVLRVHIISLMVQISDLSFAAWQFQLHKTVTSTMVAAVLFRAIVVGDYFWYEHWFFEALDGSHERFSFYNIYGFAVMMPLLWTLQTQYLAQHPVELPWPIAAVVYLVFALGFILNHNVNGQRALARGNAGDVIIWGKPAQYIKAQYHTTDGKLHQTILLCSGWWGVVGHANYAGSTLYTLASCLVCGTGHLLPYLEAILIVGTVIHRCWRDEARCKLKYGKAWDEYCARVRWRIIPGIY